MDSQQILRLEQVLIVAENSQTVLEELHAIRQTIEFQTKMQRLDFAVEHTDINDFEYFPDPFTNQLASSKHLVKQVLMAWRCGKCCRLPVDAGAMKWRPIAIQETLDTRQTFRERLCKQLFELTGVKPRLEYKSEKDGFLVYYS
jgi:hypothetical protein